MTKTDDAEKTANRLAGYERISGILNLLRGGVFGVFLVLFDAHIRGQVLRHREIFTGQ